MNNLILCFGLVVFFILLWRAFRKANDYENALIKSEKTKSNLILYFYTPSCPMCALLTPRVKKLKKSTESTESKRAAVIVLLNVHETDDYILDKYAIDKVPTIIVQNTKTITDISSDRTVEEQLKSLRDYSLEGGRQ